MTTICEAKVTEALDHIAAACTHRLEKDILARMVPIPANQAVTISRMAPPMRAAQTKIRDDVDPQLEAVE